MLEPVDVSVFGALKEEFRRLLRPRTISTANDGRNDVFKICELRCDAYQTCFNPSNAIYGFSRTGIWCDETQGVDIARSSGLI